MIKLLGTAALLAVLVTSCAATWTIRWTMPTQDNVGTCAVPLLQPTLGGLVRARISWSGAAVGQDSVIAAPGTPCTMSRTGPSGVYRFIALAADSVGNVACEADTLDLIIRGRFQQVTDLRAQ